MRKLPRRVKIGGIDWRLRNRLKDDGTEGFIYGRTTIRSSLIEVTDQASRAQQRDTLLHELLHALLSDVPHSFDEDTEEWFVRAVTPHLLALLRDNPDVIKFLTAID